VLSRTQTLLLENNPGAEILRLDPYAGHIANTAPVGAGSAPVSSTPPLPPITTWEGFRVRWQGYGPRDLVRRGLRKLGGRVLPPPSAHGAPEPPKLTDERTVAQFRALSWLLGNLDRAAVQRELIQKRRKRSDREIFERFPLYVVPTYPGDHALFDSPGFQAWLPSDLPLERKTLQEVMDWGG
ncbi:MAG TPA: hypothetical protein VEP28_01535, partial [Rubrobacter sp.]|nr:hypothetical protein [Rubrobacter sp.]